MKKQSESNQKHSNTVEIIYILDRSGSMTSIQTGAIQGFNNFLIEQKQGDGKANLSLVLFDDQVKTAIDSVPLDKVEYLNETTYTIGGSTALLDAVGSSIKQTRKRIKALPDSKKPAGVIVAIFTDGFENASQNYTMEKVSKMISKRQDKDEWEFLFLAANQDAIATADQFNIPAANAATVDFDSDHLESSYRANSRKIHAMRAQKLKMEMDQNKREDLNKDLSEILDEES